MLLDRFFTSKLVSFLLSEMQSNYILSHINVNKELVRLKVIVAGRFSMCCAVDVNVV